MRQNNSPGGPIRWIIFLQKNFYKILFFLFLIIGIISRIWKLGIVPGDLNADEAFSAYEAYSLLHYGMDSAGYPFPVYLTVWGSGMSALNSYLMIPFIAVFGPKIWVIRLPQVIIACLTLWASFLLVRRLINEKVALCALFLLAIAPWHITMSRWGYLAMFLGFKHYYFTEYNEILDYYFCHGLENAVNEAVSYDGTVYFSRGLSHSNILFLTREPVTEYIDTVEYYNYPSAFLEAKSFGRYSFEFDPASPDQNATYVLSQGTDLTPFEQAGFTLHVHENYVVAHYFK